MGKRISDEFPPLEASGQARMGNREEVIEHKDHDHDHDQQLEDQCIHRHCLHDKWDEIDTKLRINGVQITIHTVRLLRNLKFSPRRENVFINWEIKLVKVKKLSRLLSNVRRYCFPLFGTAASCAALSIRNTKKRMQCNDNDNATNYY